MVKIRKSSFALVLILCISLMLVVVSSGQADPVSKTQETLADISLQEKAVLETLFILSQEIEEMSREEEESGRAAALLQKGISELSVAIKERQENHDLQLEILKQVLATYQKRGPASFLETLLSADNLTDFLKRINVIRDLSHNTGELLDSLEKGKSELLSERETLQSNMTVLESKRQELQNALAKKLQLKKEQEVYLDSLEGEKEHYQEQLNVLDKLWGEVKVVFSELSKEFSRIIQEGNLSLEDFNLSFSFTSVKGSISEEKINEIVQNDGKLPEMVFDFTAEGIQIELPEKHLLLRGSFAIENESTIKFEVTEGTFYGLPLEEASIEELFRDGYLLIDLKGLIGTITLKKVEMKEGFIEFSVNPFF